MDIDDLLGELKEGLSDQANQNHQDRTHDPMLLNVALMKNDVVTTEFTSSMYPKMMTCHRKVQYRRLLVFSRETCEIHPLGLLTEDYRMVFSNFFLSYLDDTASENASKSCMSMLSLCNKALEEFTTLSGSLRDTVFRTNSPRHPLGLIQGMGDADQKYILKTMGLMNALNFFVIHNHASKLNVRPRVIRHSRGEKGSLGLYQGALLSMVSEFIEMSEMPTPLTSGKAIYTGVLRLSNTKSIMHIKNGLIRVTYNDLSFIGSVNILNCINDYLAQRINSIMYSFAYYGIFNEHLLLKDAHVRLRCYYQLVDELFIIYGNDLFSLLKDIEVITTALLIEKCDKSPIVNFPNFPHVEPKLKTFVSKKYSDSPLKVAYDSIFSFLSRQPEKMLVEFFGTFRHHGHPIVTSDESLSQLVEYCRKDLPVNQLVAVYLACSLKRILLRKYFLRHSRWPDISFGDSEYEVVLGQNPELINDSLLEECEHVIKEAKYNNRIPPNFPKCMYAYSRVAIPQLFPTPGDLRVMDILTDKALCFDIPELKESIRTKKSFGSSIKRRLLDKLITTNMVSVADFLQRIDSSGISEEALIMSLCSKEGELGLIARLFGICSFELRLYLGLTEDMISTYIIPELSGITMLYSESQLWKKFSHSLKFDNKVQIRDLKYGVVQHFPCNDGKCNGWFAASKATLLLGRNQIRKINPERLHWKFPNEKDLNWSLAPCNTCTDQVKLYNSDKKKINSTNPNENIFEIDKDKFLKYPLTDSSQFLVRTSFSLDFSKWNRHFRHGLCKHIFHVMDSVFGYKRLIRDTHKFFHSMILFPSDGILPVSEDLTEYSGSNVFKGIQGGIEGQRQKGWTVITNLMIKYIMNKLGYTFDLLGQGDNQVLCVNIWVKGYTDYTLQKERILAALESEFKSIGHTIKPEETWESIGFFSYGKTIFLRGSRVMSIAKSVGKLTWKTNEALNTFDNSMATLSGNVMSSSVSSESPIFMKFLFDMELQRLCMFTLLIDPIFGLEDRSKLINSTLHRLIKKFGYVCSDMVTLNYERTLINTLSRQVFLDSNTGGYPSILPTDCFIRSGPDKLTQTLSYWRVVSEHQFPKNVQTLVNKYLPKKLLVKDVVGDLKKIECLLENPEATHIMGSYASSTTTTDEVLDFVKMRGIGNRLIADSLLLDYRKLNNETLLYLAGMSSWHPRLFNLIYECLPHFHTGQLLTKILSSQTYIKLWTYTQQFDAFADKLTDTSFSTLVFWELIDYPNKNHIVPLNMNHCPVFISNYIRKVSFGREVHGVTVPDFFHTISNLDFSSIRQLDYIPNNLDDSFVVEIKQNILRDMVSGKKNRMTGFVGSQTKEKKTSNLNFTIQRGSCVKKFVSLFQKSAWMFAMNDNLMEMFRQLSHVYHIDNPSLEYLAKNNMGGYSGSHVHRLASRTSNECITSLNISLFNHIMISNNNFNTISRKLEKSFSFQFQKMMLYMEGASYLKYITSGLADIRKNIFIGEIRCKDCLIELSEEPLTMNNPFNVGLPKAIINCDPIIIDNHISLTKEEMTIRPWVGEDYIHIYISFSCELVYSPSKIKLPISTARFSKYSGWVKAMLVFFSLDYFPKQLFDDREKETRLLTLNEINQAWPRYLREFSQDLAKNFISRDYKTSLLRHNRVLLRSLFNPHYDHEEITNHIHRLFQLKIWKHNPFLIFSEFGHVYVSKKHFDSVYIYRAQIITCIADVLPSVVLTPILLSGNTKCCQVVTEESLGYVHCCQASICNELSITYYTSSSHLGFLISLIIKRLHLSECSIIGSGACCLVRILNKYINFPLIINLIDKKTTNVNGTGDSFLNEDILSLGDMIELRWKSDHSGRYIEHQMNSLIIDDTHLPLSELDEQKRYLCSMQRPFVILHRASTTVFLEKLVALYPDHVSFDHYEGKLFMGARDGMNLSQLVTHPFSTCNHTASETQRRQQQSYMWHRSFKTLEVIDRKRFLEGGRLFMRALKQKEGKLGMQGCKSSIRAITSMKRLAYWDADKLDALLGRVKSRLQALQCGFIA